MQPQCKPLQYNTFTISNLTHLYLEIHQKQSPIKHLQMVQFCQNGFMFFPHSHTEYSTLTINIMFCSLLCSEEFNVVMSFSVYVSAH